MSKKTKDNFENGIFWELYTDLERQLQVFLEYVPYLPGNEDVYSFKLLNLILVIGGHIDSAFKEMIKYKGLPDNLKIKKIREKLLRAESAMASGKVVAKKDRTYSGDFLSLFEKIYRLSEKRVEYKILLERETHKPFEEIKTAPNVGWWRLYNGLKHHVSVNLKEANIKNALDALATAFLLNVIHDPAILRLNEYKVLKWKHGEVRRKDLEYMLKRKQKIYALVETPLFIYDYEQ